MSLQKIDPRLTYLLHQFSPQSSNLWDESLSMLEDASSPPMADESIEVGVLVGCRDEQPEQALSKAGLKISAVVQGFLTVVAGRISLSDVEALSLVECVEEIEISRPLVEELDISLLETYTHTLHQNHPEIKGEGVIIGIIDSGIDYTHPAFRNEDGTSRILYLWDQQNNRKYTQADLNQALSQSNPFESVPHKDYSGHGTHVTGIAAGNGKPDGQFTGIAPKADLIIVALSIEDQITLGNSINAVNAFDYIIQKANGRPVAINMSQGMNGGGHSGETLLEAAINNFSSFNNVVIIKSAGNEGGWRTHAGGRISQGEIVELDFVVPQNNRQRGWLKKDFIELWYDGEDTVSIALQSPDQEIFPFTSDDITTETAVGNKITLQFKLNASGTGDTQATLILDKKNASKLQPGRWKILLRGDNITQGRYDIWIERAYRRNGGVEQIRFTDASADESRTISIPGTTKGIITVGSYVTRPEEGMSAPKGQISTFSSRGPSRYGLQKPEIVAPGEMIIASRSQNSTRLPQPNQWHTSLGGTSMAAPHVTGAAALILSVRSDLTCEQVKQILMQTTRQDGFAVSAPNHAWGNGKLMVENAVSLARTAVFPQISQAKIEGTTISWQTDIETTGAIRFHTHQRQLQLGKNLGSQATLKLQNNHQITLTNLTAGTYYCEILAFSEDNWRTIDDNDRAFYQVVV